MFDLINSKIVYFTMKEWKVFSSIFPDVIVYGKENRRLYFSWANLRIEYYPNSEELWIKNSIHKFYNAVVRPIPIGQLNHDDFTVSNLSETVEYICKKLNRKPEDFELFGRFEYGMNINVSPYRPMEDIISSYISHGTTSINPFYGHPKPKGKIIGSSSYSYEYRVKFYDKSKQAEIQPKNILRYEICNHRVGRLKKLLGKSKVTLKDLMSQDTHRLLARDLIKTYDDIKKLPTEYDDVPLDTMLSLMSYSQPTLIKFDKRRMSSYKFNMHRSRGKQLMHKFSKSHDTVHSKVRELIVEKLNHLISSPSCNIRDGINKETIIRNNKN